jgi:hypothetical protein
MQHRTQNWVSLLADCWCVGLITTCRANNETWLKNNEQEANPNQKEKIHEINTANTPKAQVTTSNAPDPLPYIPFAVSFLVVEIEIELVALI